MRSNSVSDQASSCLMVTTITVFMFAESKGKLESISMYFNVYIIIVIVLSV